MKVLIIQLARLGDNFQTWPVVKSFKRNNPNVELHYMCRTSFKSALSGLDEIDRVWELNSAEHINHIENSGLETITNLVNDEIVQLQEQKFDKVINLTFSPLSSYITEAISNEQTQVLGYTRHQDGYLNIVDDASALFFGQLGVGKFNRIHITRLFSAVLGIDLIDQDWSVPDSILAKGALRFSQLPEQFITVHIGGSASSKLLTSQQWSDILNQLSEQNPTLSFVLLGSENEIDFSKQIAINDAAKIINYVGQTQVEDLFHIIDKSRFLVAPDSSLVHISSLLNKQCVNLSFSMVNFWETGPLSRGSYVLWNSTPLALDSNKTAEAIHCVLHAKELNVNHAKVKENSSLEAYELVGYTDKSFEWQMIKAIYLGDEFPILDDIEVYNAFKQLAELADMAIRDLEMVRSGQFQNMNLEIIANVEKLVETLQKLVPQVRPIIWWFNTEKIRIGPWSDQEVFDKNFDIYNQLRALLSIYVGTSFIHGQVADKK